MLMGSVFGRRFGLSLLVAVVATIVATAGGGVAVASPGATGLPDGRVYEQVSPANKYASEVCPVGPYRECTGAVAADGDAAVFEETGAAAGTEAVNSTAGAYVSRREPGSGWVTTAALPNPITPPELKGGWDAFIPSVDYTGFVFKGGKEPLVKAQPDGPRFSPGIFLSDDPFQEPLWLSQPQIPNPYPEMGFSAYQSAARLTGASSDLGQVYFTYAGTLLPQDQARAAHVSFEPGGIPGAHSPWGFYEWDGHLNYAGTLPDGSISPWGAVAAAVAGESGIQREQDIQTFHGVEDMARGLSADGKVAYFVSPDPLASKACVEAGGSGCTPELYARETASDGSHHSVLVSRSELSGKQGAPSPTGVDYQGSLEKDETPYYSYPYVYASADGGQAFFLSEAQLTGDAPEGGEAKWYDFATGTQTVSYMNVPSASLVVVASADGRSVLFENMASSPRQLELWHAGGHGGSTEVIAELPFVEVAQEETWEGNGPEVNVDMGRVSADGNVFVFKSSAAIPGGFTNGKGYEEVYRYEVASKTLDCISCAPTESADVGDAQLSWLRYAFNDRNADRVPLNISEDGSRVFFDTPDALVPQDTNGTQDVYEWEDGRLYLISSGASGLRSLYVGNSASGGDVFFETAQGLVPGDGDGGYDLYDARISRPGDNPSSTVPCKGSVCQGPPSVPQLLGEPSSATFNGQGDVFSEQASSRAAGKSHTRRQKLARALKRCRKRGSAHRRRRCRARARRRYGVKTKQGRTGNRHGNGRSR